MKTARKVLIIALCAVLLVSISVMGTMAYLTSQDSVKNTFTVGNVKITLDELDVDKDSNTEDNVQYGEGENATIRDRANAYKLLPGQTYTKDPIIHVDADSEACYLFVKVENGIKAIEAAGDTVASQMLDKGWKLVHGDLHANEYLYVYAGTESEKTAVAGGASIAVFDKVVIDGEKVVNVAEGEAVPAGKVNIADYQGKTVKVTAYAVQKDGFEDMAPSAIWTTAGLN